MESWKDNNLSAILEYPFDFERFIAERMREIDDLDERKYAKKILAEGLGKIIRLTEAKYQQLERRVYEELEIADNQYEAVMTIVRREHYDPTNGTLYPVVVDDLDVKKLAEAFTGSEWVWVDTIFLKSTGSDQKILRRPGDLKGKWNRMDKCMKRFTVYGRLSVTGRPWRTCTRYFRIIIFHGVQSIPHTWTSFMMFL